jgi:hypothetical protein
VLFLEQVPRQSTPPQICKAQGLHILQERCHRPLQWQDKTTPGRTDSKSLSSQVKPAPHSTDSRNLLECHPPQCQGEDSETDENTMETSKWPLRTNYLESGPTGHVNPFVDTEIIAHSYPTASWSIKSPIPFKQGAEPEHTQEHFTLSLSELLGCFAYPHCNTIHL